MADYARTDGSARVHGLLKRWHCVLLPKTILSQDRLPPLIYQNPRLDQGGEREQRVSVVDPIRKSVFRGQAKSISGVMSVKWSIYIKIPM